MKVIKKNEAIDNEVNMEIKKTSMGNIYTVKPNSKGHVVLPKSWYDPEDDIYDDEI